MCVYVYTICNISIYFWFIFCINISTISVILLIHAFIPFFSFVSVSQEIPRVLEDIIFCTFYLKISVLILIFRYVR